MGSLLSTVTMQLFLSSILLTFITISVGDEAKKSGCCETISIRSGGMGDFYQGERLGEYIKSGSSSSGKSIYSQQGGSNYLFYLANQGIWMVGPDVGKDFGGILNRDSGNCLEDLSQDWEYYREWTDSWEEDFTLAAYCGDNPPTPGPDGEPCTWGSYCNDCPIWAEANGVRYCCASNCY